MRGILAPLSPHEEITLRRVALGSGGRDHLPSQHVRRLEQLALIEEADGALRLPSSACNATAAWNGRPNGTATRAAEDVSRLLTDRKKPNGG